MMSSGRRGESGQTEWHVWAGSRTEHGHKREMREMGQRERGCGRKGRETDGAEGGSLVAARAV